MPEGDTVWRTAQRLDQALAGAPLLVADLRWPQLSTIDLRGEVTAEVVARGKNLLHRLANGVTIHSHLRMEGQWRIESTPSLAPRALRHPQLRAVVATSTWTALGLRLGDLHVLATSEEHTLIGHLGPDVLGPEWDPGEAARRLAASPVTIGAALIDQRNLAGVGTMYAAESLFLEGLDPWSPATGLEPATLAPWSPGPIDCSTSADAAPSSRRQATTDVGPPTTSTDAPGAPAGAAAPPCAWR